MSDDQQDQPNQPVPTQPPARGGKPYILMAEDNKFYAKLNQSKFQAAGFEITAVGDGQQLLDAARQRKPDIIILDLIMPIKDGFATIQELKADPELKDIKVLIFSDLSQSADIEKLKQLGAAGFLIKSDTSPDYLIDQIKSYLS